METSLEAEHRSEVGCSGEEKVYDKVGFSRHSSQFFFRSFFTYFLLSILLSSSFAYLIPYFELQLFTTLSQHLR